MAKGSKAIREKYAFIGKTAHNKKPISEMTLKLKKQSEEIHRLEGTINYKKTRIQKLKKVSGERAKIKIPPGISISSFAKARRLAKPSNSNISLRTKQSR